MNGLSKLALTLTLWVASSLIARGLYNGAVNLSEGKTFFGKKKPEPKGTYVNYNGDVILNSKDYVVV